MNPRGKASFVECLFVGFLAVIVTAAIGIPLFIIMFITDFAPLIIYGCGFLMAVIHAACLIYFSRLML